MRYIHLTSDCTLNIPSLCYLCTHKDKRLHVSYAHKVVFMVEIVNDAGLISRATNARKSGDPGKEVAVPLSLEKTGSA